MQSVSSNKPNNTESDELDLGRLIGELIDHRYLILGVTSIFTVLAIIYSLFATPIYQSDALIQVEQKQGNAILDSLSQVLPDSQPQSAPEIALLQSRMILGKTVNDLNLQAVVSQKYFPIFGQGWARLMGEKPGELSVSRLYLPPNESKSEAQIVLTVVDNTHYRIAGENIEATGETGKVLDKNGITLLVEKINALPGTEFVIKYHTNLEAISDLQDIFSVTDQGKNTGMLNLTISGDNPVLISKILNSITQNYLEQNIARQAAQNAKSLDFLQEQLPKVRSALDSAEDKLNEYRRQKDSVDLTMEAKSVLDQIVNADNQLNQLTFREAEISQLYTKEHPTYKALMEKRETLQSEKERLNKRVSVMPATQQEVLRLSRDVESGRAVYMQLLNRQQELNIAKSSAIGNVRIIDSAVTEPHAVKPKKTIVVLLGIILGGIVSIGAVLFRVLLRRGVETAEQLEELGINVYASIPVSLWLQQKNIGNSKKSINKNKTIKPNFLAVENPADLAIEAIRGLRTSLHFAMMEANNNVLMISGASPDAGKTFVSSNLAAIIAQTGKKVLFIDADMRKGYAHKLFGFGNVDGLSDILSGKIKVENTLNHIPSVDFDFISRGQVPPNPAELLMHPRFNEIIEWASKNYDLVIVDTPPVLAVTDAAIIGRYAGTTLLVVRFEENTVKEIEVSLKRFEQSGVHVKGCILNGMVKKASSYYGYGYSNYDYNYSENKK
ncbi:MULTISPECIES: polysaccharide biosynthesis tyrosine autokinase [Serratia]|jgi:tyrosine-protein kinase Etk/Wzc|uniref:Non-specific protein-tyrosine kinase n=1 Tax=Serratia proteamaculans (strain 568) TaxID=399741 RepID=A8GC49_SERP5|nr:MULTISPECIES: polysaccharide biosynthesis tyrosine autokinase [Serratia]AMG98462.1 tyrosine-protein kinase [Serratia liquefaciens]MCS4264612.1 tyrosine-protein kinase Etk/Wzc [Serratia sp. BIGb0163]NWA19963.1 polysaccharide biosynthesis tyrosine autokinase [Serratia liquefaciens]RYM61940.1 tyrosine-protein kinase [Serratia liquefaciens]HEI8953886.1 polysaccharide biosynthesis tyrosine autokinase [Serratia liquefaciens]